MLDRCLCSWLALCDCAWQFPLMAAAADDSLGVLWEPSGRLTRPKSQKLRHMGSDEFKLLLSRGGWQISVHTRQPASRGMNQRLSKHGTIKAGIVKLWFKRRNHKRILQNCGALQCPRGSLPRLGVARWTPKLDEETLNPLEVSTLAIHSAASSVGPDRGARSCTTIL